MSEIKLLAVAGLKMLPVLTLASFYNAFLFFKIDATSSRTERGLTLMHYFIELYSIPSSKHAFLSKFKFETFLKSIIRIELVSLIFKKNPNSIILETNRPNLWKGSTQNEDFLYF